MELEGEGSKYCIGKRIGRAMQMIRIQIINLEKLRSTVTSLVVVPLSPVPIGQTRFWFIFAGVSKMIWDSGTTVLPEMVVCHFCFWTLVAMWKLGLKMKVWLRRYHVVIPLLVLWPRGDDLYTQYVPLRGTLDLFRFEFSKIEYSTVAAQWVQYRTS